MKKIAHASNTQECCKSNEESHNYLSLDVIKDKTYDIVLEGVFLFLLFLNKSNNICLSINSNLLLHLLLFFSRLFYKEVTHLTQTI